MKPTGPLLLITVLQGLAGGMTLVLALATGIWLQSPLMGPIVRLEPVIIVIAMIGGFASFFHMHRLQAAKYVLRRLKTSWLSREAVTTGLYVGGLVVLAGGIYVLHWHGTLLAVMAGLVTILGFIAMFVTAMLYATIPAMRSWYTPITTVSMMGVGLFSGWALMGALFTLVRHPQGLLSWTASGVVVFALSMGLTKALQWNHFINSRANVMASTGTGMPLGPHRLQDTGTTRPPYKTQTQVWPELHDEHKRNLYLLMFLVLVIVPLLLMMGVIFGHPLRPLFWISGISGVVGAFAERWLFFADATHSSRVWFTDQKKGRSKVASRQGSPALVERYRRLMDHGNH